MNIRTDVKLADYSTMRLGDKATAFTDITTKEALIDAVNWAETHHLPILVLGGGSNVIFSNGYDGLVLHNQLKSFEVLSSDAALCTLRIGAGENWDDVVARTVQMELTGIEALSAIPGTAGATPVQNVGAYGQEIADTLVDLEAYDLQTHSFVTIPKAECDFSYRHSKFKDTTDRRYIIASITLTLQKSNPQPPFYASLQQYLDEHNITEFTPQSIRQAVIAVRARRLPDPSIVANTGSFFKNPLISKAAFAPVYDAHPDIAHWEMPDGTIKLAAGWLIEHAGLKDHASHGMKLFDGNALVFVNESAKNYADLAAFRQEVVDKVHQVFGVTLEQEPELW